MKSSTTSLSSSITKDDVKDAVSSKIDSITIDKDAVSDRIDEIKNNIKDKFGGNSLASITYWEDSDWYAKL